MSNLFALTLYNESVTLSMSLIFNTLLLFLLKRKYSFILSLANPLFISTFSILPATIVKFNTPVLKSLLSDNVAIEVIYPFFINRLVVSVNISVISLALNSFFSYFFLMLLQEFFLFYPN